MTRRESRKVVVTVKQWYVAEISRMIVVVTSDGEKYETGITYRWFGFLAKNALKVLSGKGQIQLTLSYNTWMHNFKVVGKQQAPVVTAFKSAA
ncbi:hypothetical protein EON76_00140 [bacterium]|nr:MAG: hypothetical protein EON76_00140 [bacterium]